MIAPPSLCGDPELIVVDLNNSNKKNNQEQDDEGNNKETATSSSSQNNNKRDDEKEKEQVNDDEDEDAVLDPVLPLRRFRFIPTWLQKEKKKDEKSGREIKNPSNNNDNIGGLELVMKAYIQLPPDDAIALLSGDDHTGMMIWQGSARLCQHLFDNFLPLLRPDDEVFAASRSDGDSGSAHQAKIMMNMKIMTDKNITANTTPEIEEDNNKNNDDNNNKSSSSPDHHRKLMMSSFVKESFDPSSIKDFQNIETVVEIGCGSGILGLVAGYALKAKSIIFTDGNSECTTLAEDNFNMNFEKAFKNDQYSVEGKGRPFMWKNLSDKEVSEILFAHRKEAPKFTRDSSIVICGGDIVYDFDSVVPLVETIHSLGKAFCDVRNSLCGETNDLRDDASSSSSNSNVNKAHGAAHFFLCFYPRQWYVDDNRILLENVKDKLGMKGWRLVLEAGSGDHDGTLLHFVLRS